jgi:hypothetical protein
MTAAKIRGVPGSTGRRLPIRPASITTNARLKPMISSVVTGRSLAQVAKIETASGEGGRRPFAK